MHGRETGEPAELLNSAVQVITFRATDAYVSHSGAYTVTKLRCLRLSRSSHYNDEKRGALLRFTGH